MNKICTFVVDGEKKKGMDLGVSLGMLNSIFMLMSCYYTIRNFICTLCLEGKSIKGLYAEESVDFFRARFLSIKIFSS